MDAMTTSASGLNGWTRAALIFSPIMTTFAICGAIPLLPTIERHFDGVSGAASLTRLIVSAIGISMVVGAPMAGALANLLGWRRVLLGAIGVFTVAGVLPALVDNLWVIVVSRFVVGLAVAITGTLLMSVAAALEPDTRNRWIGYLVLAGSLSALVVMPLAGLLGAISWRLPFLGHAAMILLGVMVIAGVPVPDRAAAAAAQAAAPRSEAGRKPLHMPDLPYAMIVIALFAGVLSSAQTLYTPFHLAQVGLGDPAQISFIMLPMSVGSCVLSFSYGTLRRRFSATACFVAAFVVTAAGHAILGSSTTLGMAICGALMVGGGAGLLHPNAFSFAAQISNDATRARNIGIARGVLTAGPIVGQLFLDPVARLASPGMAVIVLGGVGLLGAVMIRPLLSPSRRAAAAPA
jgi:predicted MFS family arabinose efflux permease